MPIGPLWTRQDRQDRHAAAGLSQRDVPTMPGVFAFYREDEPVFSGRASSRHGLQARVWGECLQTGIDLSRSPFRRYVCEQLGIAKTLRTKIQPTVMTAAEIEPVNEWIRGCAVSWVECTSPSEAETLEALLHAEWTPPMSRR